MLNWKALKKVFGPSDAQKVADTYAQRASMPQSLREIAGIVEGFPPDISSEAGFLAADNLNNQGWTCHERRDYSAALKFYAQALKECANFPLVWNNKGLAHFRLGELEPARQAYLEAIRISPSFIKPYCNMGIAIYELSNNLDEAQDWLKKALAIDPTYQRALNYMDAITLARNGVKIKSLHTQKMNGQPIE